MNYYPKPRNTGGTLIREAIKLLRRSGLHLPIDSHILIAVSGGCDSMAMADLLICYGRRVVAKKNIALLHVNHGWRGVESDQDELFVRKKAEEWGIPIYVERPSRPTPLKGESWEAHARKLRKKAFQKYAKKTGSRIVFTAHHADDLAETMLWRILTGAYKTHVGGILVRHGMELRPFLCIRKEALKRYLKEERVAWREDSSNQNKRFLRNNLRASVLPQLEQVFPRTVENLLELALEFQFSNTDSERHVSECKMEQNRR
jgi:tRNA(Ile)-lysidine synthase